MRERTKRLCIREWAHDNVAEARREGWRWSKGDDLCIENSRERKKESAKMKDKTNATAVIFNICHQTLRH